MNPRTRFGLTLLVVLSLLSGGMIAAPSASAAPVPDAGKGAVYGVVTVETDSRATWSNQWKVRLFGLDVGLTTLEVVPAADGSYSFTAVSPGRYGLLFQYTGTGPWISEQWAPPPSPSAPSGYFVVTAGSVTEANGAIRVGGTISGTVSRGDAAGLVQPTVSFSGPGRSGASFINKSTGQWQIWGLNPGAWRISFNDPGTAPEYWPDAADATGQTPITIALGQTVTGIDAVLDPWSTIRGTVTQRLPDGTIVPARVGISLRYASGAGGPSTFHIGSDANGNFYYPNVPSGEYTLSFDGSSGGQVWAYWGGGQAAPTTFSVGKNQQLTGMDITLETGGRVTGYIEDSYYAPLKPLYNGQLEPERLNPSTGEFEGVSARANDQWGWITDTDGTFNIGSLEEGTYRLRVRPDLWSTKTMWWPGVWSAEDAQTFEVVAGQTTPLSSFVMRFPPLTFERKTGVNRFGTAVEATRLAFPGAGPIGVPVVYLANGYSFPDALGAGPATVHLGGALLTVAPTSIPPEILAELLRLAPQRIVVVGGPTMVSDAVIAELKRVVPSAGGDVKRITGTNRYETSRAIVRDAFLDSDTDPGGAEVAFIATGRNFPDALAAGPAASANDAPVILVDGAIPSLDPATRQLLFDLGVTRVYVLGGHDSVHELIRIYLDSDFEVTRLTGSNRYETAQVIAGSFFTGSKVFLATGTNFPDALGGGAAAGMLGVPLMLTVPTCVLPYVAQTMWEREVHSGYVLGGTNMLGDAVKNGVVCS